MKKTIIALLAAASCAMGVTLEDAAYTTTDSSISFETALSSFSAVVTLDVNALKDVMLRGSELAKYTLIDFQKTGGNAIGLQTNYSSSNSLINYSGLYGVWNQGGAYSFGMNAASNGAGMEAESFWTDAVGASVALTYNYDAGTNAVFTISYADGSTTTLGGVANTSLRGSSFAADTVLFSTDFVKKAWVFDSALSVSDATALTTAAIPEPATATLSLLALAGLAARRRR